MKKLLSGIVITTLMLSIVGCAPKETLKLNEKYAKYYDTKTNAPTKGIEVEYGEVPSLEVKEYLSEEQSEEQSEELLSNTTLTLHAIKDDVMVEEPMEVKDKLEVGDYYLVLAHEDNKIQLLVSVRDTKAPEFKDFKEELSYEEGTKDVDLKSLFTAEDLSETEILIEGEVDFNKVGDYKITVIAKDLSDNETKKECTVKITEKPKQIVNAPSGGGSTSIGNSGGSSGGGNSNTNTPSNGGGSYTPIADHYNFDYAQQVFNLINQERQKAGLSVLPWADDLTSVANERAYEIVFNFSHDGFYDRYGYVSGHGEIIAEGFATPERVVNGWMNSPGHKTWILLEKDTSMAVSCYVTDDGNFFHWVAMFNYTMEMD